MKNLLLASRFAPFEDEIKSSLGWVVVDAKTTADNVANSVKTNVVLVELCISNQATCWKAIQTNFVIYIYFW